LVSITSTARTRQGALPGGTTVLPTGEGKASPVELPCLAALGGFRSPISTAGGTSGPNAAMTRPRSSRGGPATTTPVMAVGLPTRARLRRKCQGRQLESEPVAGAGHRSCP
jgi:hypothetical protein